MAKENSRHPWHLAEPSPEPPSTTGLRSRRLIGQFQSGQPDAPREIVNRYTRRLVALARKQLAPKLSARLDPEDVVQSAFRSFFVRVGAGAYVFERAGDLWRLLAQITVNKARAQAGFHTAAKRDVNKEKSPEELDSVYMHHEPTPAEVAILADTVRQLVSELDSIARKIVELRLSGESIPAIAVILERSQRTVRRLLTRTYTALFTTLRSIS